VQNNTPDASPQAFESLQALLLTVADVNTFLAELAEVAAGLTPGTSAGITTRYGGSVLTVASSDDRAEKLDESQYQNGGGPCLDALRTGQVVYSADLRTETRWPTYNASALRQGLRCSLSLPLSAAGTTMAAANIDSFDTRRPSGRPNGPSTRRSPRRRRCRSGSRPVRSATGSSSSNWNRR